MIACDHLCEWEWERFVVLGPRQRWPSLYVLDTGKRAICHLAGAGINGDGRHNWPRMPGSKQGFSHNQVTSDAWMYTIGDNLKRVVRIFGLEFPDQSHDWTIEIRQVKVGLMGICRDPLPVSCENRVVSVRLDRKWPRHIVVRRRFNGCDAEQGAGGTHRVDDVAKANLECRIIPWLMGRVATVIHT